MFTADNYIKFIQIIPTAGTFSFRNYTDKEGNTIEAYQTFSNHNRSDSKPFWVTFSHRERTYRTTKERTVLVSKNGDAPVKMKLVDYLKNSPFTDESPNLRGEPILRLYDEERDASIAVDRTTKRMEAGNLALSLSGQDLIDVAASIGAFSTSPTVLKSRVLEYADRDPESFLEAASDPTREAKSLIRRGLKSGVLKTTGRIIKWEGAKIGADEDDAISTLMKDAEMLDGLKKAVKKLK
jgi:hypothetical protein